MKKPLILKSRVRQGELGITIALVALAMVAIIGMAVLSIDLVTLYLAREEAQRSADAAALAAARVLSISGITGDPDNSTTHWSAICGPNGAAKHAAQALAAENAVGSQTSPTVTVTYSAGTDGTVGTATSDCTTLATSAFGVNPMVTVQLTQAGLPNFFSRFWGQRRPSIRRVRLVAMKPPEPSLPCNRAALNHGSSPIWIRSGAGPLSTGPLGRSSAQASLSMAPAPLG